MESKITVVPTTKSSPMMTPEEKEALQAFFDTACARLLEQGCLAGNRGGCYMRQYMDDGTIRKCVIGGMITDEQMREYGISDEASVGMLPEPLIKKMIPGADPEIAEYFMRALQRAHDDMIHSSWDTLGFAKEFKSRANEVADQFKLKRLE